MKNTWRKGSLTVTALDYPDPDIIRVEDTYYMVSTTMHFMPGCEILRSYDLVNWEHAAFVYDRLDSTPAQALADGHNIYGKGMWAASLRYHKGIFYICFVANDTQKTYLYRSDSIEGPWHKSQIEGFYHDCSLFFEEDDSAYIIYGNNHIYLTQLKADLSGPLEGGLHRELVNDEGNPFLGYEGSHFYKIHGKYYLFLIHSLKDRWKRTQACFVSDSLTGEFTGGDIFNDDMGYHGQGVAQGGIVDTPDGQWYGMLFQDRGAVGRIPVLVPMKWEHAYPVMGEHGVMPQQIQIPQEKAGYKYHPLVESDDFKVSKEADRRFYSSYGFKSCWQFNHEPDMRYITHDCEAGRVTMTHQKLCRNLLQASNMLTQRMKYPKCAAEVTVYADKLKNGDYAGLCALQGSYGMAAVTRENDNWYLVMNAMEEGMEDQKQRIPWKPLGGEATSIRFRMEADFTDMKDTAVFYYEKDGKWLQIGTEKKLYFGLDHFCGCRFGLFSYATMETGGSSIFADFRYE